MTESDIHKTKGRSSRKAAPEPRFGFSALAAAFLAGVFLLTTAARFVFPGPSAQALAELAGADLPPVPVRPLWRLVFLAVAHLPIGDFAFRMNAASALLGALSAGLLFRFAANLLYAMLPEETPASFRRAVARAGAAAAAVSLCFSLAGWPIFSHFRPEAADTAVTLLCLNLVFEAVRRKASRPRLLPAVALIQGLYAPGTGGFTLLVPLVFLVPFWLLRHFRSLLDRRVWIPVAGTFAVAALFSLSFSILLPHALPGGVSFVRASFGAWGEAIVSDFCAGNAWRAIAMAYIPAFLVPILSRAGLYRHAPQITPCMAILSAYFAWGGFGGSKSPWNLAGEATPFSSCILIPCVLAAGLQAAYWIVMGSRYFREWIEEGVDSSIERTTDDDDDEGGGPSYFPFRLAAAAFFALLLAAIPRHVRNLHLRDGDFPQRFADAEPFPGAWALWPKDALPLAPHLRLAGVPAGAGTDGTPGTARIDADGCRRIAELLGPVVSPDDPVDRTRELLRQTYCRHAIDAAIARQEAGAPVEAEELYAAAMRIDPANLSAAANRLSILLAKSGGEAFPRTPEERELDDVARRLAAALGNAPAFDLQCAQEGEILDPDVLSRYGVKWQFVGKRDRSPDYDVSALPFDDEEDALALLSAPGQCRPPPDPGDEEDAASLRQAAHNLVCGSANLAAGDTRSAADFFRRSWFERNNAPALLGQAAVALETGNPSNAEEFLRELFAMDDAPGALCRHLLAIALYRQGKSADAAEEAARAVACAQDNDEAVYPRLCLARVLETLGRAEERRDAVRPLYGRLHRLPAEMRSEVIRLHRE